MIVGVVVEFVMCCYEVGFAFGFVDGEPDCFERVDVTHTGGVDSDLCCFILEFFDEPAKERSHEHMWCSHCFDVASCGEVVDQDVVFGDVVGDVE